MTYIEDLEDACEVYYSYIVRKDLTLRETSRVLGTPRSTIHERIHSYYKRAHPQRYRKLANKLKYNALNRFQSPHLWSKEVVREEDL